MRRIAPLVCSILGLLPLVFSVSAHADKEVVAEPETIAPGKTVTLHWYFTGDKVVVSGGRFGKGVEVTGRTTVTDTPLKTTQYNFDVYYHANTAPAVPVTPAPKPPVTPGTPPPAPVVPPPATTVPPTKPPVGDPGKADKPDPGKLLHVQYTVIAEVVVPAPMPPMNVYRDPHGWQVSFISGWKRDVSTPDQGDKGLMFFQKEDDSVERLAVAVMPANDLNTGALMEKVKRDLPAHYLKLNVTEPKEITHNNVTAHWLTFSGIADSHPELRTQSIVLTVIRDGRAYIISARTSTTNFKSRQAILEKMVKSFAFGSGRAENVKPYLRRTRYDNNEVRNEMAHPAFKNKERG